MKIKHMITASLCACSLFTTVFSAEEPQADPESVVRALLEAMQEKNAEQIRSLFAEDASQAYGSGRAKSGEAFFRWLQSDIIDREGRVENPTLEVDGNTVVVKGTYRSRGYSSKADFLMTVEEGRITSWRMRY